MRGASQKLFKTLRGSKGSLIERLLPADKDGLHSILRPTIEYGVNLGLRLTGNKKFVVEIDIANSSNRKDSKVRFIKNNIEVYSFSRHDYPEWNDLKRTLSKFK